jgi:single-strand DNA-binding protein
MLNMTAVGRIGRDVELRRVPSGESVCNVVIGCNYGKRDDNTTQWVEGTIWGQRAEALAQYLTKGKQVILILSDVHIETYEGQNGPGHKLVGRIDGLEFGATPQGDQGGNQGGGGQQRQQPSGYRQQGQQAQPQGGQRNSYAEGRGRQQPQSQQRQAPARQPAGGDSGFEDMSDDIPF